jgi:2-isopropylmalate synthase
MSNKKIYLYDTTLRDGTQGEDIAFTVEDKLRICEWLDDIGMSYIEGGWPGSNPRDMEFFDKVHSLKLKSSRVAAFGSTCHPKMTPAKYFKPLIKAETPVVTIFGKSWRLHVKKALRISLQENLDLIANSVRYLKKKTDEVVYDAEHFFDGYKDDPDYALKSLQAAQQGGADWIVLCDTNGGTLPHELEAIFDEIKNRITTPLGIHSHNDSELGVANSIEAVRQGVRQVHGTINGIGERCGNANLISILPNLQLKMGYKCVTAAQLKKLSSMSRFVDELSNQMPRNNQPYVGHSAFAHKGGIHVSAVRKESRTYEHIEPELVGNRRRVLVSDLSGQSNVLYKAQEFGIKLEGQDPVTRRIVADLKQLEHQGYQFEGAEASFELLMHKALKKRRPFFKLVGFRVIDEKHPRADHPYSEATIQIEVDGKLEHTAAEGHGPVNALDNALRKALYRFFPSLREVRLVDYKVRVLPAVKGETGAAGTALRQAQGTASLVRVLVESADQHEHWGTVGVSENIIQASWIAVVDSLEYKLMKDKKKRA